MKLALALGTCLISSLFSSVVLAQGPPNPPNGGQGGQGTDRGEVKIDSIQITGTYFDGMYALNEETGSDEATAGISATYKSPPSSTVSPYGYVGGYPKLKYKYYGADESLVSEPGLLDAAPFSFGQGGVGSSSAVTTAFCTSFGSLFWTEQLSVLGHDRTTIRLPSPAKTLIRQWKLIGYAGSQDARNSDSATALAPTFSTSVDGSQFS